MKKLVMAVVLAASSLVLSAPALAHHGDAAYDMTQMVELKNATVTRWIWANPHCIMMFDVKDSDGNVVHWVGETGSPSAVGPRGWSRNFVHPGDVITVYVWKAKAGTPIGIINHVVRADGKEFIDQLGETEAQRKEFLKKGVEPSGGGHNEGK
jgi:Family of unknown function (DUF6152)